MLGDSRVNAIVPTHDIVRSRRFYEDTVGAKILDEVPGGAIRFECGEGTTFLLYQTTVAIPAAHTCMFFEVPDIDAAVTDLESRGVRFEEYDFEAMGYEGGGRGKVIRTEEVASAWFTDPEGNILSITAML
jgi:predicted enzyme related to lactoylglutathione lyase